MITTTSTAKYAKAVKEYDTAREVFTETLKTMRREKLEAALNVVHSTMAEADVAQRKAYNSLEKVRREITI